MIFVLGLFILFTLGAPWWLYAVFVFAALIQSEMS